MGCYSAFTEGNSTVCNNVDNYEDISSVNEASHRKTDTTSFHLQSKIVCKINKFIESESKMVVFRSWREGKIGSHKSTDKSLIEQDEQALEISCTTL